MVDNVERRGGGLGDMGGGDGFKHHCRVLLVLAEETQTTNPHALLPYEHGVFPQLLNRKPNHGSAVQHPGYEILNPPPPPEVVSHELQCLGIAGLVDSGFAGGGGVFGYIFGGRRGGWWWHGGGHQCLFQGF